MNLLTCAIIEDDTISMTMMEGLADKTELLDVKGKFSSSNKAMPWLLENPVDLLFLDIEMPGMSGLDLLKSLPYKPEVIIVSSKPQYAIEAYDLSVTDYLLKPVTDYGRFLAAITKVMTKRKNHQPKQDENLFVKIESLLLKLDINEILWIEAFGDYIKINTSDKMHTVYSTLKKVEEKLPSQKFVRVHRSYVVNITKITNIDPNNLEISKKIIPVSSTYRDDLLNKISVL
jgi:DNA-binding LytR/AlgR family response regulator